MNRTNRFVLFFSFGMIAAGIAPVLVNLFQESIVDARERRTGRAAAAEAAQSLNAATLPDLTVPKAPGKDAPHYTVRDITPNITGRLFPTRFNNRQDVLGVLIPSDALPREQRPPLSFGRPHPPPQLRLALYHGGKLDTIGVLPSTAGFRSATLNNVGDVFCALQSEIPGAKPPGDSERVPDTPTRLYRYQNGKRQLVDVIGSFQHIGVPREQITALIDRGELFLNDSGQMVISGRVGYLLNQGNLTTLDINAVWALTDTGDIVGKPTTQMRMAEVIEGYANLLVVNPKTSERVAFNIGSDSIEDVNDHREILLSRAFPGQFNGRALFSLYIDNKIKKVAAVPIRGGTRTFLNNRGQIAGMSRGTGFSDHREVVQHDKGQGPFLWQEGALYDLHDLLPAGNPWILAQVTGLNDNGDILCLGYKKGETHSRLLLLTCPTRIGLPPTPATVAVAPTANVSPQK